MLIDCDSCEVRGLACGDCVVTVLLGAPPDGVVLDEEAQRAIDVLALSGLVPPLRLVDRGHPGALRDELLAEGDISGMEEREVRHAGGRRFAG